MQVRYSFVKNVNDQGGREARPEVDDTDEDIFHMSICEGVTRVSQDVWHGMTSDGSMVAIVEDIVQNQFSDMFVDDCK